MVCKSGAAVREDGGAGVYAGARRGKGRPGPAKVPQSRMALGDGGVGRVGASKGAVTAPAGQAVLCEGRLWAAEGRHGGGTPPALRVARLRHRVAQLTKVWPPGVPLMQKSAEIRGKMQTKA